MKTTLQNTFCIVFLLAFSCICIVTSSRIFQGQLRFVTDRNKLLSPKSGEILSHYNKTTVEGYASSPGCPQSIDELPWVYHGNPPKCFHVGLRGPCKEGERISLQKNSLYGVCACECFVQNKANNLELPQKPDRYLFCKEHGPEDMVNFFDREKQACFATFTQGPCRKGEVIGKWSSNSLTCLPECNIPESDWKEMEARQKQGLCAWAQTIPIAAAAVAGVTDNIGTSKCLEWERWSPLLKRCLLKVPEYGVRSVIG